jgi:Zn-dependent M28 family amino/carboxypeptidase
VQAVHSAYSGLISMLVAADVLSQQERSGRAAALTHDIVFVSFTGESVGLMGSRRFLFELEQGSNSTAGLDLSRVDAVFEVGMTAAAYPNNGSMLFIHSSKKTSAASTSMVLAGKAVGNLTVHFIPAKC